MLLSCYFAVEISLSTKAQHVFFLAMAANGTQIKITNITVTTTACTKIFSMFLSFICLLTPHLQTYYISVIFQAVKQE